MVRSNRRSTDIVFQIDPQIRRMEFEKAISVGDSESSSARCRRMIKEGSCALDASYTGPRPDPPPESEGEGGKWRPTETFVKEMIQYFREGKTLPRRLVWEIVLGCQEVLKGEKSLVEVDIPEGVTLDVIGDTHGQLSYSHPSRLAADRRALLKVNSTIFSTSSLSLARRHLTTSYFSMATLWTAVPGLSRLPSLSLLIRCVVGSSRIPLRLPLLSLTRSRCSGSTPRGYS